MTVSLGIAGYPARHSLSPAFQQAAIDALGLDARYGIWEVAPADLGNLIASLRDGERIGCNVTIPHKQAVRAFLDAEDATAQRIGAVNTVVREGGRLIGYNTDAPGFLRSLRETGGVDPSGTRALLLGTGGAGRAVAYALLTAGVERLWVTNRTHARSRDLVDEFGALGPVTAVEWDGRAQAVRGADLIVNATSLGMAHGPDPDASPVDPADLATGTAVYDLVYVPARTPLLAAAQAAGARTIEGLPMLIYQGAIAFEHWFRQPAPIDVMTAAAEKALAGRDG